MDLFKKLEDLKRGIHLHKAMTKNDGHVCRFCGKDFETGRKLGGHISRKHAGNSYEHKIKQEIHKSKSFERRRRKYLKKQKKGSSIAKIKIEAILE